MDRKYVTLGLLLVLTVALIGMPEALAKSGYLSLFTAQYPNTATTKLNNCDVCHTPALFTISGSSKDVNYYGRDYFNAGHSFTAIETTDSDVDGYTNLAEITAGTWPGDPADYPAPTPTPTPTPTPSPTATVTFTVIDSVTGSTVQGAKVSMDGVSIKTDVTGTAVFTNVALGDHSYAISKTGYKRKTGVVSVSGDTIVSVALVPR